MTSASTYFYEPRNGHGLRHDPFNAIVAPRPIGWISSISSNNIPNLAPYSFFNALNYNPPLIGFASIGWKDSIANIEETREFCWNLVSKPLAEAMNLSCAPAPADINEFEFAGVTPVPSKLITVPRVAESPVSFECRLCKISQLVSADQVPIDSWFVIGEVVAVHIAADLIRNSVFDTLAAEPVLRGGGPGDYFELGAENRFFMRRPNWPL